MNLNFLTIKNIYDTNNYTSSNFIKNKISKYIDFLSNINYQDNNIFIGLLDNNNYKINGSGIFIKNNILIEGNIKNNNFFDSKCNFIFNNSTNILFNGSIINNKFHIGTLQYDNIKLQGELLNGLPHNLCKLQTKFINYDGKWINGKKDGFGIYQNFIDNKSIFKYEGEWSNDLFHGTGILYNNNITYKGDFFNGNKHGSGNLSINDNNFYVEYINNKEVVKLNSDQKKISDLKYFNTDLQNKLDECNNIIHNQENLILNFNLKINKLEKDYRKMEETFLCKICFKNTPNILLQPCSHLCICDVCIKQVVNKKCPICRARFYSNTTIFIS